MKKFFYCCLIIFEIFYPIILCDHYHFKISDFDVYPNETERRKHLKNYVDEAKSIALHNRLFEEGKVSFERRINQFSDKNLEEKRKTLNGLRMTKSSKIKPRSVPLNFPKAPAAFDWRDQGAVSPVKDQGYSCSSCYAFAAVAAIESQYYLLHGEWKIFSEQNLIDCNKNPYSGNWGCIVSR